MVKLTGPGLATDAAGSLAALSFSHYKGRSYLKKKSTPRQPRTAKQMSMRLILGFLSSEWGEIHPSLTPSWDALAAKRNLSPINAYQAVNAERWRNFQFPTQLYPPPEWEADALIDDHEMTGMVRHVSGSFNVINHMIMWGMAFHIVAGDGAPLTWDNLIKLLPVNTAGTKRFNIGGLTPGPIWIAMDDFNLSGKESGNAVYLNATIAHH